MHVLLRGSTSSAVLVNGVDYLPKRTSIARLVTVRMTEGGVSLEIPPSKYCDSAGGMLFDLKKHGEKGEGGQSGSQKVRLSYRYDQRQKGSPQIRRDTTSTGSLGDDEWLGRERERERD